MSADLSVAQPPPQWIGDALVAVCAKCAQKPGARYKDGSGVCQGCGGAGYKVLARRASVPPGATDTKDED